MSSTNFQAESLLVESKKKAEETAETKTKTDKPIPEFRTLCERVSFVDTKLAAELLTYKDVGSLPVELTEQMAKAVEQSFTREKEIKAECAAYIEASIAAAVVITEIQRAYITSERVLKKIMQNKLTFADAVNESASDKMNFSFGGHPRELEDAVRAGISPAEMREALKYNFGFEIVSLILKLDLSPKSISILDLSYSNKELIRNYNFTLEDLERNKGGCDAILVLLEKGKYSFSDIDMLSPAQLELLKMDFSLDCVKKCSHFDHIDRNRLPHVLKVILSKDIKSEAELEQLLPVLEGYKFIGISHGMSLAEVQDKNFTLQHSFLLYTYSWKEISNLHSMQARALLASDSLTVKEVSSDWWTGMHTCGVQAGMSFADLEKRDGRQVFEFLTTPCRSMVSPLTSQRVDNEVRSPVLHAYSAQGAGSAGSAASASMSLTAEDTAAERRDKIATAAAAFS